MSKEAKLNDLVSIIRRNYPPYPSTFGNCSNGCGGSARGSGICPNCAEKELGKLINIPHLAELFHNNTRENAAFLSDMLDAIKD